MSDATPQLLITNVGLAAASIATPTGPYIHIVGFRIGSGYGYTPTVNQTGLIGNDLYDGTVTSYTSIGNNTLDILLTIPPDAGPFEFGEVGLYLADTDGNFSTASPLFAIGVFDSPQTKFSSLGTNVVSSYQFNCLLTLAQSVAVFQISPLEAPVAVLDIYQWSDVYPPGVSANPDIPIYNIRELSNEGEGSLLSNSTDSEWTLQGSYQKYRGVSGSAITFSIANASSTWIQVAASNFGSEVLSAPNRKFVIRTAEGFFRSVNNVQTSGSNYQFNLNCTNDGTYNNYPLPSTPEIGEAVTLYANDYAAGQIYYQQILNPPSIPLGTATVPGLMSGGSGTYVPTPGTLEVTGMLHAPSTNTGRVLTSADDLDTVMNSGIYSTIRETYGTPNNYPPVNSNGTFYYTNVPDALTQLFIAYDTTPTQMWIRSTQSGDTDWNAWSQLGAVAALYGNAIFGGSVGGASWNQTFNYTFQIPTAGTWNIMFWSTVFTPGQNNSAQNQYINGALVNSLSQWYSAYTMMGSYSNTFTAGQSITLTLAASGGAAPEQNAFIAMRVS
jgi:hypothetical protein